MYRTGGEQTPTQMGSPSSLAMREASPKAHGGELDLVGVRVLSTASRPALSFLGASEMA